MANKGLIFLGGGGDEKQSYDFDSVFFKGLPKRGKLLYIPVALDRDTSGYEDAYSWFRSVVNLHAKEKDIEVSMLLKQDLLDDIDNYDAVYLGGGNTYKLLSFIKSKSMLKMLTSHNRSGKPIYGGSAGAIVLGKNVSTVEEENEENSGDHLGMNLIQDISFRCHYQEDDRKVVHDSVKKVDGTVIAIEEESGLLFDPNTNHYKVFGKIFVFDKDRSLSYSCS